MKSKRTIISLFLCFALVFTSFASLAAVSVGAADTAAADTSADVTTAPSGNNNRGELILKAWNWPISVIKENLDAIAAAGFTVIETSPVNGLVGYGNSVSNWYQFYQPTNYRISNKICTGTEQFSDLCQAAEAKGIKIIVDVVLNHTTNQKSSVDQSLRNYHTEEYNLQGDDYKDRRKVTQWMQSGMPDLNTQDDSIQTQAHDFLQSLIDAGASGFRFDAAKHIELPKKYEGDVDWASDYWENVLNLNTTKDLFMYGEILGGDKSNDYMNYMKITASGYGVYNAIQNYYLPADTATGYEYDADPEYLVCYVETHDRYVDGNYGMSNFQLQLGWAAMAAQGNNCLYLARPNNIETDYYSGVLKPDDYSGSWNDYFNKVLAPNRSAEEGGDGAYYLAQVAEVNKFHNAMSGEPSYCSNLDGENRVLAVRRGEKGVCIINAAGYNQDFSIYTGMPDGKYLDKINNKEFTVTSGWMTGTVESGKIYPIYGEVKEPELSDCRLHGNINGADYYGSDYTFDENGSLTAEIKKGSFVYINDSVNDYKTASYVGDDNNARFFKGNSEKLYVPAGTVTFTLSKIAGGGFSLSYTYVPAPEKAVYLKPNANWTSDNQRFAAYVFNSDTDNAWISMTADSAVSGLYKAVFTDEWNNVIFCRMDGSTTDNNWGNKWNQTADLDLNDRIGQIYTVTEGAWDNGGGAWSSYKHDYTVVYTYKDAEGETRTITKEVKDSVLTDAQQIASLNDPSSTLKNNRYKYSLGTAEISGSTVNAELARQEQTYTVKLNNIVIRSDYKYLDKATVNTNNDTNFYIDGSYINSGKSLTVFVTGNIDIETSDGTPTVSDYASIEQTGTFISDTRVSYELLASAKVQKFERMGVAFCISGKTENAVKNAVSAYENSGTQVVDKIAVHNSNVDSFNESGLYQFAYAPYITNAPSSAVKLDFYTFAVTKDGGVVLSEKKEISISNSLA